MSNTAYDKIVEYYLVIDLYYIIIIIIKFINKGVIMYNT